MNLDTLPGVNRSIPNIFHVDTPYYWVGNNAISREGDKVVFFGNNFKTFPKETDLQKYIEVANQCLDFIRRECRGLQLFYKPHPDETDEHTMLNLDLFTIIKDRDISELYIKKNINDIKYVFSVGSWTSLSAFCLGLNAYVFFDVFHSAFPEKTTEALKDYFKGLPSSFFIKDLTRPLEENRIAPQKDLFLEKSFEELLKEKRGKIWFIAYDPGLVIILEAFARLIHSIDSARKLGLIVVYNKRWERAGTEIYRYFDSVHRFPRIFYSLRPGKIIKILRQALQIMRFKINKDDIIMGLAHSNFIEDAFISYNKKNLKISLLMNAVFELNYNNQYSKFFKATDFKMIKASIFFSLFLEPLLGLYRTVFLQYSSGDVFNIDRYRRPINELYDRVFVIDIPKHIKPI